MKNTIRLLLVAAGLLFLCAPIAPTNVQAQAPTVQIPQPGVPQIMTMEGRFVRAAYNNEGYAILGYRMANLSVGQEWMVLEAGFTLRDGVPDYTMLREALSIETPDGKTTQLATVEEYRQAPVDA